MAASPVSRGGTQGCGDLKAAAHAVGRYEHAGRSAALGLQGCWAPRLARTPTR